MKNYLILFFLFFSSLLNASEKPWQVSGQFTYEYNKPLACEIFCSLALLQETFDLEMLEDGFYETEMEPTVQQWILHSKKKFIEINYLNQALPVFIKNIEIKLRNDVDGDDVKSSYSLDKVDVVISILFSTPETMHEFDIKWLFFPDPLLRLRNSEGQLVKPENYEVPVTFIGSEIKSVNLSSKDPSYTWLNKPVKLSPIVPQTENKTFYKRSHFSAFMVMLGISVLGAFFSWIIFDRPKIRLLTMLSVFILGSSFPLFKDLRGIEVRQVYKLPDQYSLELMMSRLLINVYRGPASENPSWMFHQISKASTGKFLDKTFTQIYQSKAENPDTLQIVEDLKIESCEVLGEGRVKCQWTINAHILHLHHIHGKNLRFKAIFKLKPVKGKWLIDTGEIIPVLNGSRT